MLAVDTCFRRYDSGGVVTLVGDGKLGDWMYDVNCHPSKQMTLSYLQKQVSRV